MALEPDSWLSQLRWVGGGGGGEGMHRTFAPPPLPAPDASRSWKSQSGHFPSRGRGSGHPVWLYAALGPQDRLTPRLVCGQRPKWGPLGPFSSGCPGKGTVKSCPNNCKVYDSTVPRPQQGRCICLHSPCVCAGTQGRGGAGSTKGDGSPRRVGWQAVGAPPRHASLAHGWPLRAQWQGLWQER